MASACLFASEKDPFQSRDSFLWVIFVLTCESESVPYTPDGL